MLRKDVLEKALAIAVSTGADFAEIFVERSTEKKINMIAAKVDGISDSIIVGVGIRIFKGTQCIAGSCSSLEPSAVYDCAQKVADAMFGAGTLSDIVLAERKVIDIHPVRLFPCEAANATKIDFLREAWNSAKNYHSDITQVQGVVMDVDHNILVANTEGLLARDRQIRTRMTINAIVNKKGETQNGTASHGARVGLELFEQFDPRATGMEAAEQAMTMIHAGYIDAGVMPVAIENGFGGVIFHEACGHSLEATSVAVGSSQFCGKLGQQIANPKVTAIDDATIPNAWGSYNIDDEGTPSQKNILIENGVLKNYLVDKLNGRRMGMESTGCSRRQSYAFAPTSRMSNTYIAAGNDEDKDIIASIEYGLFAKKMGGGSVNTATGQFNFAVDEGYIVRNGQICEAVRGASLIGKGSEIIQKIDMVGKNLDRGQGMCGSSSGSIPTDVGQPLIRVSSITVGGR